MAGFTDPSIKKDHPTRADAIASVIQMTAQAISKIDPSLHPEMKSAIKEGLIKVQEKSINVIKISSAWD